jgi:two-component system, cell cycle sensor histidine kinase and response regulator CckA
MPTSETQKLRGIALRTAVIYTLVAGLWIVTSDRIAALIVTDAEAMAKLSIAKGWFFVLVTGSLLYVGLRRQLARSEATVIERQRTAAALRESEERFRQIAENINEVFWIAEADARPDDNPTYVSPAYDVVWGRSSQGLMRGEHVWSDAIHPDDRARLLQVLGERAGSGGFDQVYRIVRPGGAVRWIRDRAFPVRDASGRVYRIVGTAEDITERHTLEEQFRQAQKMQAIGTLAGGIAHDFNNLLGAITGFAEIARMQLRGQPAVGENLEDILAAGRRAVGLVRQILAFSRRSSSERVLMQLRPVVDEAVHLLRSTIPSTIEIICDLRRDVPAVVADPTQVHQVVMNLATNAWHAMRDRPGRLEVRVERCEITPERVREEPRLRAGLFARVSLNDTGTGIAPDHLERIFEPFFTTKDPGEGTGLGLAVVHGIMREHDGFITVDSTPGAGSSFQLHFPAVEIEEPPAAIDPGQMPRGRGQRVLFVDDEPALVRLGIGMLHELGYAGEGAETVPAALERVQRDPASIDLVITDQTMPVMTGTALAAALHGLRPELPVILVTGYAGEPEAEAEHHGGGEDLGAGVGDALACDVGSGAAGRFVEAEGQAERFLPVPRLAEEIMPSEPQITAISSERMSPNMFSVKSTSNWFGSRASCMAALSTYMWLKRRCRGVSRSSR